MFALREDRMVIFFNFAVIFCVVVDALNSIPSDNVLLTEIEGMLIRFVFDCRLDY